MPSDTVFYFGYGQNRDPQMIRAIVGRTPPVSYETTLEDYELCVQNLGQIPEVPRGIVEKTWYGYQNFQSYAIRPKEGSQVKGRVYVLTPGERDLIVNYELVELGWTDEADIAVPSVSEGSQINAVTEVLGPDQEVEKVVGGLEYDNFLNDRERAMVIATQARLDYFERIKGEGKSSTGEIKE